MDIEKLKTFITVARLGSFSMAADELYLTASAVSKHIAALERELGQPLFVRETKKVTLTPWGKECLGHAEKIVTEYNSLKATLGSGELKVACIPFQNTILPLINRFSVLWPTTTVTLIDRHGPDVVKAVKNREFELGFAGTPYSQSDKLQRHVLYEHRIGAVLPADHPLVGKGPISIRKLEGETFYLMGAETGMFPFYLNILKENDMTPQIISTSTREDTVVMHVAGGDGVSLLTEREMSPYNNGEVAYVDLKEEYHLGIVLLRRYDRPLSATAQRLWDFILSLEDIAFS